MKRLFIPIFLISLFLFPKSTFAKVLPRFSKSKPVFYTKAGGSLLISPRLRADRQALLVTFSNVNSVKNSTYTLIYQTDGVDQGVSGQIDPSFGNAVTRELLFGTCSSGVCRYHSGLQNMRLEIVSEYPNGKKTIKRYRVRV